MDTEAAEIEAPGTVAAKTGGAVAPSVYVVILNWNSWSDTLDCLDSLARCRYPDFRVVIVDNDSGDCSLAEIRRWCGTAAVSLTEKLYAGGTLGAAESFSRAVRPGLQEVVTIRADRNLGFCAGNNVGTEFALRSGADFLLILNNDTVCEPDFIDQMVFCAQSDPGAGMVGGLVYHADAPQSLWWSGQKLRSFYRIDRAAAAPALAAAPEGRRVETSWITGCLMLIPRHVYERVGGFDEQFFLWHEDIDLSLRVLENGYRLLVAPAARISHKGSRSIGRLSPLAYYYSARNFLLLSRRHNRPLSHLVHVGYFLGRWGTTSLWFLMKGRGACAVAGWCGVLDYFLRRFGKALHHDKMCAYGRASAESP